MIRNGKNWLHLRKLVNPLLRAGALHPYLDKHCEIADDFVVHLKELSDTNAGRITDCLFDLYKYTQEGMNLMERFLVFRFSGFFLPFWLLVYCSVIAFSEQLILPGV